MSSVERADQRLRELESEWREVKQQLRKKQKQLDDGQIEKPERRAEEERLQLERKEALREVEVEATRARKQLDATDRQLFALDGEISEMRGRVAAASKELSELETDLQEKAVAAARTHRKPQMALLGIRPADAAAPAPIPRPPATAGEAAASATQLCFLINLDRRPDRLAAMRELPLGVPFRRLAAVDGRSLTWESLVAQGIVYEQAMTEATWAEASGVPTVCRQSGSFSPHLTLAAVGCAMSHRRAWERLTAQCEQEAALILEDDAAGVCSAFPLQLQALMRNLPNTWQLCYLGFHESSASLLPPTHQPRVMEAQPGTTLTGLFGYLLRRSAAIELLADRTVFPLRHQIDVVLSRRTWRRGCRFALAPEAVMLAAPRSEEGRCDTDVQTLGDAEAKAHAALPADMLLM